MKKSFVLIAAIVAVVGLGTAVAVAEDTIKVKTSLKLKFSSPDSYSGTVKARKGCQEGRKVTLTHGVNKLGSDNSNNRGKYKIIGPTSTGDGLRAVARETKITQHDGDKIVCERGRSKKVKIGDNDERSWAKETIKVETSANLRYKADDPSAPYEGGSFSGHVTAKKGCQKGARSFYTAPK